MLKVNFYRQTEIPDEKLRFAVIASKYKEQWIFCRHKNRNTWEVPGGHRESGETIFETAKRELYEETGAVQFQLTPICIYSVSRGAESFGMLYYAVISRLGELPPLEIETIRFFDEAPKEWTYPEIQPKLMSKVREFLAGVQIFQDDAKR